MTTRAFFLSLAFSLMQAGSALAGSVINTNLPTGVAIVNINAQQDGCGGYDGDQAHFYSPFSTQGSAALLTLPIAAGTYSFTIIDPADAAAKFPDLTSDQLASLYTAWTYNSPWVTDYMVFDFSAVNDSSEHQLFDGAPETMSFSDAQSAYDGAVAGGYAGKIRDGNLGRDGTVLISTYTFAAATTLVFAVPDNGLGDNAGGISVIVAPAVAPTQPTIAIASPPDGITVAVGAPVTLAAGVNDPSGVLAQVQFFVNGVAVGSTGSAGPFTATASAPAAGTYMLAATATDTQGRTSTSSVTVTAVAADPLHPAPTANLLTPLAGLNLAANAMFTLTATADSPATGLDHVNIYADAVLVASFDAQGNLITSAHGGGAPVRRDASSTPLDNLFTTPYIMPAADKIVNMIVVAFDKLQLATVSGVSSFHSTVTTDLAPLVAISNFAPTAEVPVGSVNTVDVTATDPDAGATSLGSRGPARQDAASDALLASLEYYINGANLAKAVQPPYSFAFDPPTPGKYVLHAVATDGSGLSTVSDPVVVDAVLPTVTITALGDGTAVAGGEAGKVAVRRTGDTSTALTVRYKVKGAAQAGVDYKALAGSVTIPAGAAQAKLKLKPLGDPVEGTRVAKLKLLPSVDGSYTLGTATVAKIKIIDNE